MTIWIDAQLSPAIATWITNTFGILAVALRDLGLSDAEDCEIFEAAKAQGAILMTKDSDYCGFGLPTRNTTTNHLVDVRKYVECAVTRDFEFNTKSLRAITGW